jgi:hypothetical protein
MSHRTGRTYRVLFMLPAFALYIGTAYWLEWRGTPGWIIAAAFSVQGVVCALILPAVLRKYWWWKQLKCAAGFAWIVSVAAVSSAAGVHSLPWRQQALALGAYVALVLILYVAFFRRSCPD